MKWSAVNSDTEWDLYGERMSLQLYHKMLEYIKEETPPPASFKGLVCSDYWCGGMPYLSLSHYPDLNGKAVPGEPLELFIDGKQLKARGILFDSPLGTAVWKALKKDEMKTKSSVDDDKIRISIAFLDLAHKHGDMGDIFKRNSLTDICQDCKKGVGNKIYLDGYLVHLALTRVPVNPRTIIKSEDAMTKKAKIQTRKEDALSIVEDSELVEDIDETNALEAKSDILVEMSDTEEEIEAPLVEESKPMMEEEEVEEEPKDKKKKVMAKENSLAPEEVAEVEKVVSQPQPVVEIKADTESKSTLDIATDKLYTSVRSAIGLRGATLEERLESVNPSLQELGTAITVMVRESMGALAPTPASNESGQILEAIAALTQKIDGVATEVATMKAQTTNVVTVPNRVPVPRSIQPQLVAQSQAQNPINPNSVANIVRRSVSAHLPLK